MTVTTTPHVNFRGRAREALEFYGSVFGGRVTIATYADIHAAEDEAHAGDVAFGRVDAPSGFRIMAYDVQPSKDYAEGANPFYITLDGTEGDEVLGLWNGLAESARAILTPIGPSGFGPLYGMLTDRFGVTWIVGAATAPSGSVEG